MGKAGRIIKSRTTFGRHERGFARIHCAESTILTQNAGRLAMKRMPTLSIFHVKDAVRHGGHGVSTM